MEKAGDTDWGYRRRVFPLSDRTHLFAISGFLEEAFPCKVGNEHPFPDLINILRRNDLLTRAGMDEGELGAITGVRWKWRPPGRAGCSVCSHLSTLMRNGPLFLQVCVHCKYFLWSKHKHHKIPNWIFTFSFCIISFFLQCPLESCFIVIKSNKLLP